MATSEECNSAWAKGFNAGYKSITGTTTSVPARPSQPASVSDPIKYFYEKGYQAGITAAR